MIPAETRRWRPAWGQEAAVAAERSKADGGFALPGMSSSYSAVDQWTGEKAEEAEEEQEENGDVVGDGTTFEDALKRGLDLVTGPSFSSSNLDTATPPGKNGPLLLPGGDSSSTRRRRRSSLSW